MPELLSEKHVIHKLLYRINEACNALGIGRTSFYDEVRAKRLILTSAAGRRLVHWHDLESYAEARRAEALAAAQTVH